jgi:hypothetical protein
MVLVIDSDTAAWALSALAVTGALVRLVLVGLAVHAARKALGAGVGAAGPADRAHRLAVLRALLKGLRGR